MPQRNAENASTATAEEGQIRWLMVGDPVIRWQTMRDLGDEPSAVLEAERREVRRREPMEHASRPACAEGT